MSYRLGDAWLNMVDGGDFRPDGGAMHGAVPKTIWSRLVSCDEANRCPYATHCLLAYDLDVEATVATKKQIFERAEPGDWLPLFGHDRHHGARLIRNQKDQWVAGEPVDLV